MKPTSNRSDTHDALIGENGARHILSLNKKRRNLRHRPPPFVPSTNRRWGFLASKARPVIVTFKFWPISNLMCVLSKSNFGLMRTTSTLLAVGDFCKAASASLCCGVRSAFKTFSNREFVCAIAVVDIANRPQASTSARPIICATPLVNWIIRRKGRSGGRSAIQRISQSFSCRSRCSLRREIRTH